jgi:hypothetical protein
MAERSGFELAVQVHESEAQTQVLAAAGQVVSGL